MELNRKYTEILKLYKMLNEAKIPCEIVRVLDGWQIFYPDSENKVSDAIEFTGSYGCGIDTLEIMGLLTFEELEIDSVAGFLTAEDVFNRWKAHYEQEDNT